MNTVEKGQGRGHRTRGELNQDGDEAGCRAPLSSAAGLIMDGCMVGRYGSWFATGK